MLDRLNEDFRFFQQSLRAQRQEVLSSNIANADTPNYKARDFDFRTAMQTAMEGSKRLADTSLTLTSARHIPAKAVSQGPTDLLYRLPYQPSMDGNTVEMDVERAVRRQHLALPKQHADPVQPHQGHDGRHSRLGVKPTPKRFALPPGHHGGPAKPAPRGLDGARPVMYVAGMLVY